MSLTVEELEDRIKELNANGLTMAAKALERELSFQKRKAAA